MSYAEAEQAVTDIEAAIELAANLESQLTDAILETDVGTITTLQEKITQLKATLEAAKETINSTVEAMKSIESSVKG